MLGPKKIIILTSPYAGHCNPIFGVCSQLNKVETNTKILVFGDAKFKSLFEKCGAEFRLYPSSSLYDMISPKTDGFDLLVKGVDIANRNATGMCQEILREKPDLILYDKGTCFPKFILEYVMIQYKKHSLSMFKLMGYSTTFQLDNEYPNEHERNAVGLKIGLKHVLTLVTYAKRKRDFNRKYGIQTPVFPFISNWEQLEHETTVVFTFPQLQARSHLRNAEKFKFVGSSLLESVHFNGINDSNDESDELKELLAEFPVRSHEMKLPAAHSYLVYVSLGTLFNTDALVFQTILKALESVNALRPLKAVISTGESCYDMLVRQRNDHNSLGNRVLLLKTAPQIEMLKRASLFVTHSGMNSTSEAVHFGVPMICLPMAVGLDQPLVAYRVADELGLGVRMKVKGLNQTELSQTMMKILTDESFYERALVYSDISQKYNGIENTCKLICNALKN